MSDSAPETNETDAEYRVSPTDPNVATPDPMMPMPNIDPPADDESNEPRRFQFSLLELILLVTGASIWPPAWPPWFMADPLECDGLAVALLPRLLPTGKLGSCTARAGR